MDDATDAAQMAEFLRELAGFAAGETLPRFRKAIAVDNKEDAAFDPVTEADREAERVIRQAIETRFPEDGIEGEEFGLVRADASRRWVIDPIDGTRSFICGIPLWGTLVGLMDNGVARAGFLSQPYLGEIFIADGSRAFLEGPHGVRDLKVSDCRSLASARMFTTDPQLWRGKEMQGFEALRASVQLTRYGADCYGFAMLAAGQADIAVESGVNSYDVMALIPIIRQAGGVIARVDGGPAEKAGTVVAAATQALYDAACEKLCDG
ncbi:histidinol-phosphatase [Notoacmeibacter sp. MSK16QG-6]|uniref:histidinol-phosphatase n=1 Tax=Notoacmeibacter sp. MSK16QG-6 TaxID=2957982 RepID=UPI00209F7F10|nr:histidinol-phosphatase [Notoacmeibacter sp. MSK16QG-6]MCP1200357.1 histidinol-phosphatase [Notoacmeibacter sp. MSK16QG-6]